MSDEVKALQGVEIKSVDEGRVLARFATYNEVDHHDDITRKGAFDDGAEIVVSAFNHGSWGGALPVGKGRIRDAGDGAVADLEFFMDTQAGRDTFATVKRLGNLQQWSYGFDVQEKGRETVELGDGEQKSVRVLKKVKVHEVSPVLLGAGKSTSTLAVKMEGEFTKEKLEAAGYSVDDIIALLEEKAGNSNKPKPRRNQDDDDSNSSDSSSSSNDDDDDEDDSDDAAAARRRRQQQGKKPNGSSNNSSSKLRMSDQTGAVITAIGELADRAEEIVTLRKAQGKSGISESLNQQFHELLKQADRIFELYDESLVKDEDDEVELKQAADEQQAAFHSLYAHFMRDLSQE